MSEDIKILKVGECPSLSARSVITYEVGCKGDKSIHLRVSETTGGAIFNKAWIPLMKIDHLLTSEKNPITTRVLRSLFQGKSINNHAFLGGILIAEGLLKVADEKLRTYEWFDPTEFKKRIQSLMDADIGNTPSNEGKPPKVKKAIPKKSEKSS